MRILPYRTYSAQPLNKTQSVSNPSFSSQKLGDIVINDFMKFLQENKLYLAYDKDYKVAPFDGGRYIDLIRIEMRSSLNPKEPLKYFSNAFEMHDGKIEIKGDYFKDRHFGIYGEGKTIRAAMFDMMEKHAGVYFAEQSSSQSMFKKFPDFYDIKD